MTKLYERECDLCQGSGYGGQCTRCGGTGKIEDIPVVDDVASIARRLKEIEHEHEFKCDYCGGNGRDVYCSVCAPSKPAASFV